MQHGASPQASISANWGTKELVPHIKISLEESTFLMTGVDRTYTEKEKKEMQSKLFVAEGCLLQDVGQMGTSVESAGRIVAGVSDIESYNPQLVVSTGAWRSQKMSLVLPGRSRIGGLDVMIELQSGKSIVE